MKISITSQISIDDAELREEFVRSSGPGGQNVNKVATAVQLYFDVKHSPSLTEDVRQRLVRIAGRRVNREGILVVDARRFRTQEQNRQDALDRLVELIRQAAHKPKPRRRTKPSLASKERRLENKRRKSETKKMRQAAGHW